MYKWEDALRAILAQILQQRMTDEQVLDFFTMSMSSKRREGQPISTYQEMINLLASLIKHLDGLYLILDGVDECDDPDETLLTLWKLRDINGLRILVFSRPNVGFLRRILGAEQSIHVLPASLALDLELYFRRKLEDLQDLRLLPPTVAVDELISDLQLGANGMFLWARLMMSCLKSPALSSSRRLSIISGLKTPEKLDKMYDRIITLFSRSLRHEQAHVRNIVVWLTFGALPLSCTQLYDILNVEDNTVYQWSKDNHSEDVKEFENTIIVTCGGLVEFRHHHCYFVHHTAWEYFRSRCSDPQACAGSPSGSVQYFFPPDYDTHAELAIACLSYVMFRTPAEPLSGSIHQPADPLQVESLMPFLKYAALRWPRHLQGTLENLRPVTGSSWHYSRKKLECLLRLLSRFLSNKVRMMSWIETLYTFTRHEEATHSNIHQQLPTWTDGVSRLLSQFSLLNYNILAHTLAAFSQDITLQFEEWGSTLSRYPNQIWTDATAFQTSRFLQQSLALSVKELTHETLQTVDLDIKPFTKISRFHRNSGLCAILTIWSSRQVLRVSCYPKIW